MEGVNVAHRLLMATFTTHVLEKISTYTWCTRAKRGKQCRVRKNDGFVSKDDLRMSDLWGVVTCSHSSKLYNGGYF